MSQPAPPAAVKSKKEIKKEKKAASRVTTPEPGAFGSSDTAASYNTAASRPQSPNPERGQTPPPQSPKRSPPPVPLPPMPPASPLKFNFTGGANPLPPAPGPVTPKPPVTGPAPGPAPAPLPPADPVDNGIAQYQTLMIQFISSSGFQKLLKGEVLEPITDAKTREGIIIAALRCVFIQPQGVGQMNETKGLKHIKNNRNWQPFCQDILDFAKSRLAAQVAIVAQKSNLYKRYGNFWPDCEKELAADVAKAGKK